MLLLLIHRNYRLVGLVVVLMVVVVVEVMVVVVVGESGEW